MDNKKFVIGVTGAYCSGKSTVARIFAEKGALRIDADAIGHEVLEEPDIKAEIAARWGEDVLHGDEIDRKALAEKVFIDGRRVKELTRITHPRIVARIREEIQTSSKQLIVLDAPLLFEAGIEDLVDIVIVVRASTDKCLARAAERGVDKERAERIISAQMPARDKEKRADHIIDNNGDLTKTKEGVDRIWQEI